MNFLGIFLRTPRGRYAVFLAARVMAGAFLSFFLPQTFLFPNFGQAEEQPRHILLSVYSMPEKHIVKEEDSRELQLRPAPIYVRKCRGSAREDMVRLLFHLAVYIDAGGRLSFPFRHLAGTPFRCLILYVHHQDGL